MVRVIFIIYLFVVSIAVTTALFICGKRGTHQVVYDPRTHGCKRGHLYDKTTALPTSTTTTTTPTMAAEKPPACNDPARVTKCGEQKLCDGYQCCGTSEQPYHPHFSTCCKSMWQARVHHNMPEKDHVCCDLNVFNRGDQTCLLPASNDALWSPAPYRNIRQSKNCFNYAYVVLSLHRPKGKNRDEDSFIDLMQVSPKLRTNNGILNISIKFDPFSPRRKLRPGKTLLLTNHKRSTEDSFFVFSSDEVYSLPKKLRDEINRRKSTPERIPKRLSKNCNKLKRKRKHPKTYKTIQNKFAKRRSLLS